jgi:hypothetical protein
MASAADVLERAAKLIEPEGAWTQGAFSLDETGSHSEDLTAIGPAVCWCVLGAIAEIVGVDPVAPWGLNNTAVAAKLALSRVIEDDNVPMFNDAPGRTQAEVVAKLREAAAKARGEA